MFFNELVFDVDVFARFERIIDIDARRKRTIVDKLRTNFDNCRFRLLRRDLKSNDKEKRIKVSKS